MSKTFKTMTSVAALACAGASFAQGAHAQAAAADPAASEVTEVVVTAQRRSETLVDVPISVATATPADIERAGGASIDNLTKLTPGVFFQRATYGLSPTVRGIGSTLVTSGGEQNVALYVDNIYYPTPTGNIFDLASVSGIEVLKGPQGTLFGRNATGGAILVHTKDPDFTTEGAFNASYERFDQVRTSGYVNLPLGDKVAVNLSSAYRHSRGYVRDLKTDAIVNEGENFTIRGKLLFQPTDNFTAILTAAHADLDDPAGTTSQTRVPAPVLLRGNFGPIASGRFESSKSQQESTKTSTEEYSARLKWDLGFGTLSSYTARLDNELHTTNDLSGTYFPSQITSATLTKTFSQEVNFTSPEGKPLTYVAGLFYFDNKSTAPGSTTNGTPVGSSKGEVESVSAYLDGAYEIGPWSLIAGLRYSYEKREVASAPGRIQPAAYTRFQEATEKQWTPRVGVRYALADRTNVYATYSKGFKAGIFDAQSATGPGVGPEKVDAFEVGFKTAAPRYSLNAAAFYYDYSGTQVTAVISGQNGVVFSALFNVPKAEIYGVEADATIRVGDNFDVRIAAAYTHARYIDFPNAPAWILRPGATTFANIVADASGNHMVRSPDFTASSTLRYHTELAGDKSFELSLTPYFSSRVYHTFDNALSQAPYATLDVNASLTFANNMKVSVFGRNVFDTVYAMRKQQNSLSLDAIVFAPPASYGVSFGYTF